VFFQTGTQHVELLFATVRQRLDAHFAPRSVLDFGCGVGRMLLPLAERCERAVGVDVSETMLAEAREHCGRRGLSNVRLVRSDGDDLSSLGTFDLVHSFIVLQHISPARGEAILRELVGVLNPGGVGVLHFAYARKLRPWWLRDVIGAMRTRALRLFGPIVEMYPYDLNRVFTTLHDGGVARLHVELTDHHYYGALLFFQR
jgi:ubiquinone/menaquinone biosynthesis C-methylase UbiE